MKLGVSSYSFRQLVAAGTLQLIDLPAKAKEMGFDVVEFSALPLPKGKTPLSFAPKLREACDRAGIPVANYTIAADFLNGSKGEWKAEAERLKDEVRVAKILGAPGMRHDVTRGYLPAHKGPRGFDDALPVLAQGCRAVTEFAADQGIRTMIENHGFFCQNSARVEKLMNAVNHPNFGWLVDMGNFLCVDEDPGQAVGRAMPYAFHVHAKDFHVKSGRMTPPGAGCCVPTPRGGCCGVPASEPGPTRRHAPPPATPKPASTRPSPSSASSISAAMTSPAAPRATSTPGSPKDRPRRRRSATSSTGPPPAHSPIASTSPDQPGASSPLSTTTHTGPSSVGSSTTTTSSSATGSPAASSCSTARP